jgi:two-component sensor histidine kinase
VAYFRGGRFAMAVLTPSGGMVPPAFPAVSRFATDGFRRDGALGDASRYRAILNAIDHGFCVIEVLFDTADRPLDYRFLEVNAAFAAQTGLDDPVGRTMLSLRPDHERHWFELYGRVALTGEPLRFEREAAALGRWYAVYAFRIDAPEDRRVAILFNDITAQKREAERVRLLAAEVDHRAKNMLTVVASLVRLTRGGTVEAFRQDLLGRVQAMARSQRVLAGGSQRGADLTRLVQDEMAPYLMGGRLTWSGPTVTLSAESVQPIAMALHELATNATKYGALSLAGGKVAIEWSRRDGGDLHLCWRESGGPAVEATPTHKGLGTSVVTMGLRDQLGGDVTFNWRREGLLCEMTIPANVVG